MEFIIFTLGSRKKSNTSLVFIQDAIGTTISQKPFEGDTHNKYFYDGKELRENMELEWYDYGARFYDLVTGRWSVRDPLSEKYIGTSPYVYCNNNPLKFVDPDGQSFVGAYGVIDNCGAADVYIYDAESYANQAKEAGASSVTINGTQIGSGPESEDPNKQNSSTNSSTETPKDQNKENPSEKADGLFDLLSLATDGTDLYASIETLILAAEETFRRDAILPYLINIDTGEITWLNPTCLKLLKVTGMVGGIGSGISIYRAIKKGNTQHWTRDDTADLTFSILGTIPYAGSYISLAHTGTKSEMKWKQWYIDHNIDPTFLIYNPSLGF